MVRLKSEAEIVAMVQRHKFQFLHGAIKVRVNNGEKLLFYKGKAML